MSAGAPPIKVGGAVVGLSERIFQNATVVGSPAADAETIIASLTISDDLVVTEGVLVVGFCAFLLGASGVSSNVRLRKTDASGTILKSTGTILGTAADLLSRTVIAFDTSPTVPGQVYVMTLTVASGAAASTVSAVTIAALVV